MMRRHHENRMKFDFPKDGKQNQFAFLTKTIPSRSNRKRSRSPSFITKVACITSPVIQTHNPIYYLQHPIFWGAVFFYPLDSPLDSPSDTPKDCLKDYPPPEKSRNETKE